MIRLHLMTAFVIGFVFLFVEIKTAVEDDCFGYRLGVEFDTVGGIAKDCFQSNRCIGDLPEPLSCLYANVGMKPYDEANVEMIYRKLYVYANPKKLDALNKSTKKCAEKIKEVKSTEKYYKGWGTRNPGRKYTCKPLDAFKPLDSTAFFNCTAYDMKEICPDDQYIKTKDC